ncbi:DNA damage-responsive 48 [Fusarium mundagurra]|uniref:DNA damage-responsive 48 n=1 Tax=Fusarium mundagurra TaxID=1567541 RepID=A0A8H5Z4U9_9HYPO|nr:DNA damage-responsive 48 [Fusarium mundagurra]
MDFVKNLAGGSNNANNNTEGQQAPPEAGGSFMDKVNGMAGGGAQGEKNEDGLDKAVDFVQEKFLGGGDQSNESAAEQAKDEAISDAIRDQYKSATGSEFPISDKDKKYGA